MASIARQESLATPPAVGNDRVECVNHCALDLSFFRLYPPLEDGPEELRLAHLSRSLPG